MNAAGIATALGEARREGRGWRCRCPLHGGHSLVIRDGEGGRVLVTCWGGCNRLDVLAELRRHCLIPGPADGTPHIISASDRHDDGGRTARALKIWRNSRVGVGTIADGYLASRGIVFDRWPSSVRFQPDCPRPRNNAGNFQRPLPAMVALVEHVQHGAIGVHCTYPRPDGSAMADLPKNEQRACFGKSGVLQRPPLLQKLIPGGKFRSWHGSHQADRASAQAHPVGQRAAVRVEDGRGALIAAQSTIARSSSP